MTSMPVSDVVGQAIVRKELFDPIGQRVNLYFGEKRVDKDRFMDRRYKRGGCGRPKRRYAIGNWN